MSISGWGAAITFTVGLVFAAAAGIALLMHKRSMARALGITAFILLWPVNLWFAQFQLTERNGLSTSYLVNLIVVQITLLGVVPLVIECFLPFRPVLTTIQLLYVFNLILQFFSYTYWSYGTTRNFSSELTHLDSFYFALGTLTTAGTGNLSAVSETGRKFQTFQMLIDFIFIGFVVALVIARYSTLFRRPKEELEGQFTQTPSNSGVSRRIAERRPPKARRPKPVNRCVRRSKPAWQRRRENRIAPRQH